MSKLGTLCVAHIQLHFGFRPKTALQSALKMDKIAGSIFNDLDQFYEENFHFEKLKRRLFCDYNVRGVEVSENRTESGWVPTNTI